MSAALAEHTEVVTSGRLKPSNFRRLAGLIHAHSGIKMPPSKQTMLEGRLRRRAQALGLADINLYCERLFAEGGLEAEFVHLLDAVTTNKTEFFREPAHFELLSRRILPDLKAAGRRSIKVWSAAASIGAEAYTLAMVLEEFRSQGGPDYSILGTDLSTQVLRHAAGAIYPEAMIEPVPMALRLKHLLIARDPARQEVRIAPHLRAKARFGRLNLMDETYPVDADMDLVFCRNILIYFDKPTQAAVLRRLCGHIRQGGYLFLGHSESIFGFELPLVGVANTVFRKV